MRSVNVDTHEGYWGDDDLRRNGDDSESDLSFASSLPTRSDKSAIDGLMFTPPRSRIQQESGFNTPLDTPTTQSRSTSRIGSAKKNKPVVMPLVTGGSSSASNVTSPSSSRPAPPNTPESRRRHIAEAFRGIIPAWRHRSPSPSLRGREPLGPATDSDEGMFNDTDEEREIFMLLTDSEDSSPSRPAMSASQVLQTPKRPSFPSRSESMPTFRTPFKPIKNIFNMQLADKLPSVDIAHDDAAQKEMDKLQISWGVQYEIARGVHHGLWSWSEAIAKLPQLTGKNIDSAYRVVHVLRNRPLKEVVDRRIWEELDREQDAIIEGKGRGLGLMGAWKGDSNWHGGQIQQLARLFMDDNRIHIKLEPMEKRRSHRFARYCGSRRILQVRIPDDIRDNDRVRDYLCHKFILCGRVFVPFHAKDSSVHMVEIKDAEFGKHRNDQSDRSLRSFTDFVNWHNPLALNRSQPISKYASRFALGLSNSVPVIEFQAECIHFIEDEIATGWDRSKKPPSEKIMTDGCGFINRAAMLQITDKMRYGTRPTAVQARIGGAKGLWILDPDFDMDHRPRIWIRDSQNKIKYTDLEDRSHRILELLCVSQPASTISLSEQTILNLYFNGVPQETLIELLEQGLQDKAEPLMDWSKPIVCLWAAINHIGGVSNSRAARYAAGRSRALGVSKQEWGSAWLSNKDVLADEDRDAMDVDDTERAAYTGINPLSGEPVSLHEVALALIQAGFVPSESSFLRSKIRYIIQNVIDASLNRYQIPLQESISALVVPDPLGILKEGQIYYRSSVGMLDPATSTIFNVLKGEVLVGRYPVRLESDIQKVTAVDIVELSDWPDVVIVSTKGKRSAANILSGGDYDGDELFIIRETNLVIPFQNKALVPEPPDLQKKCFDISAETVEQFSQRELNDRDLQRRFQYELLSGLNDAKVGLYSHFHEYSIFKYGYNHEDTVLMAYMFTITLDSGKTGLRLKPEVFRLHKKRFLSDVPEDADYILNRLLAAGRKKGDTLLAQYDLIETRDSLDDLTAPWLETLDKVKKLGGGYEVSFYQNDLDKVKEHVDMVYEKWCQACRQNPRGKQVKDRQKKRKQRSHSKNDHMEQIVILFHEKLDLQLPWFNIDQLKASYACKRNIRFAMSVAFTLVCNIKGNASPGGIVPCIRHIDEMKSIGPVSLRVVNSAEVIPF